MMKGQDTRLIAFYLPQFHTFPENDRWWGEGFTEWTNVRKAKPLYPGHRQPRKPEDGKYYDLTNAEVMQDQMHLAQRYGIYGFCYYHYWFDGKLLLEKPLEQMLRLQQKLPYLLCWANEPWTRSWEGSQEVLMPQKYGEKEEWEAHFLYLLKFFRDPYYIQENRKPMLVLYRTNKIPNCDAMVDYWNRRCVEEGFDGIYVVEEKNGFQTEPVCSRSEAVLEFEPMYTLKHGRSGIQRIEDKVMAKGFNLLTGNSLLIYGYDRIWKRIIKRRREEIPGKVQFPGAFTDWDNTPRKGKRGLVITGANPEKFGRYMARQMRAAAREGAPYLFINAWNEWGEGAYLEPDREHGFGYLEKIRELLLCGEEHDESKRKKNRQGESGVYFS